MGEGELSRLKSDVRLTISVGGRVGVDRFVSPGEVCVDEGFGRRVLHVLCARHSGHHRGHRGVRAGVGGEAGGGVFFHVCGGWAWPAGHCDWGDSVAAVVMPL